MYFKHLLRACGCSLFIFNSSCTLRDFDPLRNNNKMGAGAPEVNEDGKFADSHYNHEFFEKRTKDSIYREKNNLLPGYDWERAWRVSFASFERMEENPKYKKDLVIKLRKEAGLQIWPFMLR